MGTMAVPDSKPDLSPQDVEAMESKDYMIYLQSRIQYRNMLNLFAHLTSMVAKQEEKQEGQPTDWAAISKEISDIIGITPKHPLVVAFDPEGQGMKIMYERLLQSHHEDAERIKIHRDYVQASEAKRLCLVMITKFMQWKTLEEGEGRRGYFQSCLEKLTDADKNRTPPAEMSKLMEDLTSEIKAFFRHEKHKRFRDVVKVFMPAFKKAYIRLGFPAPPIIATLDMDRFLRDDNYKVPSADIDGSADAAAKVEPGRSIVPEDRENSRNAEKKPKNGAAASAMEVAPKPSPAVVTQKPAAPAVQQKSQGTARNLEKNPTAPSDRAPATIPAPSAATTPASPQRPPVSSARSTSDVPAPSQFAPKLLSPDLPKPPVKPSVTTAAPVTTKIPAPDPQKPSGPLAQPDVIPPPAKSVSPSKAPTAAIPPSAPVPSGLVADKASMVTGPAESVSTSKTLVTEDLQTKKGRQKRLLPEVTGGPPITRKPRTAKEKVKETHSAPSASTEAEKPVTARETVPEKKDADLQLVVSEPATTSAVAAVERPVATKPEEEANEPSPKKMKKTPLPAVVPDESEQKKAALLERVEREIERLTGFNPAAWKALLAYCASAEPNDVIDFRPFILPTGDEVKNYSKLILQPQDVSTLVNAVEAKSDTPGIVIAHSLDLIPLNAMVFNKFFTDLFGMSASVLETVSDYGQGVEHFTAQFGRMDEAMLELAFRDIKTESPFSHVQRPEHSPDGRYFIEDNRRPTGKKRKGSVAKIIKPSTAKTLSAIASTPPVTVPSKVVIVSSTSRRNTKK